MISVAYFGALNLLECGIVGKGGIFVAVFAHEVDVLHHILHAVEFGSKFFYVSAIGVFDNPIADVVQTRGVAVDVTAAIANGFEVVCKVAPRVTTGEGGASESVERVSTKVVQSSSSMLMVSISLSPSSV